RKIRTFDVWMSHIKGSHEFDELKDKYFKAYNPHKRAAKGVTSDRVSPYAVSVYSYDGDLIKSWTGKFDVAENANKNQVYFDNQDGKRVIIDGGIIINEEN
ncbi:MAG: hypothetical protein II309_05505, partial [Bacilli bacterium]|nr:hypothetical protein [Bacilli bacterium]